MKLAFLAESGRVQISVILYYSYFYYKLQRNEAVFNAQYLQLQMHYIFVCCKQDTQEAHSARTRIWSLW